MVPKLPYTSVQRPPSQPSIVTWSDNPCARYYSIHTNIQHHTRGHASTPCLRSHLHHRNSLHPAVEMTSMAGQKPHRPRILPGYTPTIISEPDIFPGSQENIPYNDPHYTATKFGGLSPFFNPGAHWPLCGCCGRPQTFVGQINLDDRGIPLPIRERLAAGGGEGIFQLFWWSVRTGYSTMATAFS